MTRTFGVDVYGPAPDRGRWNWDVLGGWELEPRFALVRGGVGLWTDPLARENLSEAIRQGLRASFWFVLVAEIAVADQVRSWLRLLADRRLDLPRSVDYEQSRATGRIPTASQLLEAFRRLEDHEGRESMGYSRRNLIEQYLAPMPTAELNARWWWLAQYLTLQQVRGEHPGPVPDHPARMARERILIHQTADRLPPPAGAATDRKTIDYNRWCGPMSFEHFVGDEAATLSLEQRVERIEGEALRQGWTL